jgi:DNA-directed RNA polymerase specialized sigma24 family protein
MTYVDSNRPLRIEEDKERKLISLYDEYYGKVARYAYVRIGDKQGSEDIASEVFTKALDSLKTYQERGLPMQAWLFRIAHNLVVDHLRKVSQRKRGHAEPYRGPKRGHQVAFLRGADLGRGSRRLKKERWRSPRNAKGGSGKAKEPAKC